MKVTSLPANLDARHDRVYLTLLANADATGLVTRCNWTTIMDFATIQRQDEAQGIIKDLEDAGIIQVIHKGSKSRHYHLLNNFQRDIKVAQDYYATNLNRVNTIRNARTQGHALQQASRAGLDFTTTHITIEDLERIETENMEKVVQRWRFSARVAGLGMIHSCMLTVFEFPPARVSGPIRRGVNNTWIKQVEFDANFELHLRTAVEEAIQEAGRQAS